MTRRIEVRKSGRIVISATLGIDAGSSFVIKIPCQRWLLENEKRNVEALESIHNSDVIPASIKRLVPIHLASGRLGNQPFYVESALAGTATRKPMASRQVASLLMELNKITARTVTIGPAELQRVADKIAVIRLAADNSEQRPTWLAIERFLTADMLDQQIPAVWSHGDIGSSYLQNRKGNVSGIFDWETFEKNSFPLYDWTLLCVARHDDRWKSVALAFIGREDEFFKDLPLDNYLELMSVDRRLIPSLVLCAWIEYAAHRFSKRGCDPIWVRTTIVDVLNQCEKFLPATIRSQIDCQNKP